MLGRLVNEVLRREPPAYPWGDTLPLFRLADWRTCNLECVISDHGSPWSRTPKPFHFRSDARNLAVLKAAHIDAVSLANNHSLDFDYPALFDLLRSLDRAGIAHSGAGAHLDQAARAAISNVRGFQVGVVSFTDNQSEWEATSEQPGVFYAPVDWEDERTEKVLESVRVARQQVDLLIVAAHWGPNWGSFPPPEHASFARKLVQAGADVIFGHSPHVGRGIEICNGRPILYSTGDFIDDYAVDEDERNDHSFIFMLETEGARPRRLKLRPTVIQNFQARLAGGSQAAAMAAKMTDLCAAFGTPASWDPQQHCLTIEIPPVGSSPVPATRRGRQETL